jgi:hypothetical protein
MMCQHEMFENIEFILSLRTFLRGKVDGTIYNSIESSI